MLAKETFEDVSNLITAQKIIPASEKK